MIPPEISRLMSALSGGPSSGGGSCGGCGGGSDPHSDSQMVSKSLESLAAQATEIRKRMECGGSELPSWAEHKVYRAHDAIKDALSATFVNRNKPKMMIIIRKAQDSGAKKALEYAGLSHSVTGEKSASLDMLLGKLAAIPSATTSGITRTLGDFMSSLRRHKSLPANDPQLKLWMHPKQILHENPHLSSERTLSDLATLMGKTGASKTASMESDYRNWLAENPTMNPWFGKGTGVLSMDLDKGTATAHTSGEMPVSEEEDTWRRRLVGGLGGLGGGLAGGLVGGLAGTGIGHALDWDREDKGKAALLGVLAGGLLGGGGLGYHGYRHGRMQDEHSSIHPSQVASAIERLNALQGVRVPSIVQDPGGDSLRFYHHDAPEGEKSIRAINRAIHGA